VNGALEPTLIAAGVALLVAIIGLIGVPISAQMTGLVQNRTERRKRQAKHESDALGSMLRAWTIMGTTKAGTPEDAAALCDWQVALAEMAAYGGSEASAWLASFVRHGSQADAAGQMMMIEAIYAVRRAAVGHHVKPGDRGSIRVLLFGPQVPGGQVEQAET
jgi:hypothetical protein